MKMKRRRIVIGNTEYQLFSRFTENGKKLFSVRREIMLNPYCWDSTFYNVNMSWRRFKKLVSKEVV